MQDLSEEVKELYANSRRPQECFLLPTQKMHVKDIAFKITFFRNGSYVELIEIVIQTLKRFSGEQ